MHSALTRLQAVFGYFTSVASMIALAIALLSLLQTPTPTLSGQNGLALKNVQVVRGKPHYYSRTPEPYAHVTFSLDVDLSELFTWNTKQVFVYVTASWPSTYGARVPARGETAASAAAARADDDDFDIEGPDTRGPAPPVFAVHAIPHSRQIVWDAVLAHPLARVHENQYSYSRRRGLRDNSWLSYVPGTESWRAARGSRGSDARPGILKLNSQRPKYVLTDPPARMLAGLENATLELNWNVQPWVGALSWCSPSVVASDAPADIEAADPKSISRWFGADSAWSTWRRLSAPGARTNTFAFPALKEKKSASGGAAQKDGLGTEKGNEKNRGKPA